MNDRELAIAAIKEEASRNPNVKVGMSIITYPELVERLEKEDPVIMKRFVKPYEKKMQKNPIFKQLLIKKLGLSPS